eukprot:4531949-Pyramimonas_sp.AAC.1
MAPEYVAAMRRIGAGLAPEWRCLGLNALAHAPTCAGLAPEWRRLLLRVKQHAPTCADMRRIGAGMALAFELHALAHAPTCAGLAPELRRHPFAAVALSIEPMRRHAPDWRR